MRATIVITIDERTRKIDKYGSFCEVGHEISKGKDNILNMLLDNCLDRHYKALLDDIEKVIHGYRTACADASKTAKA